MTQYANAVRSLPCVKYLFYDDRPADDLKVVAVFEGDRWQVRPHLYSIEMDLLPRFPGLRVDIERRPLELADIPALQAFFVQALPA